MLRFNMGARAHRDHNYGYRMAYIAILCHNSWVRMRGLVHAKYEHLVA